MARGETLEDAHYQCRGCSEEDTIVEISLEPRIFSVKPTLEGPYADFDGGVDETFTESEHVIGYGCMTFECKFWQGNYGGDAEDYIDEKDGLEYVRYRMAPKIDEVAEVM